MLKMENFFCNYVTSLGKVAKYLKQPGAHKIEIKTSMSNNSLQYIQPILAALLQMKYLKFLQLHFSPSNPQLLTSSLPLLFDQLLFGAGC